MNRNIMLVMRCMIASLLLVSLNGCLKDNCKKTLRLYSPIYKPLSEVRASMKSGPPQPIQRPGKLFIYGHFIFLNESGKGIHVIDNTDPQSPQRISFITVPGNLDLALTGNTLYADSYADLVVFDLTSPQNVSPEKFVSYVFPDKGKFYSAYYNGTNDPDSIKVVAAWESRDTTVDCDEFEKEAQLESVSFDGRSSTPGIGGSMARFTILNNYLYTVTASNLHAFDIAQPLDPTLKGTQGVGWNIETIFPFRNKLFIGSQTGMFIYDASTPANPVRLGAFTHGRSCDPVIADDNYAFVTLRAGTICQGTATINQLDVLDIRDLLRPSMIRSYTLTNPHGLSKDGSLLFICDGKDGLKVYNAANVNDLKLIKHITGLTTYDVIAYKGLAIVVAQDGLYQFDYQVENNIKLVSKIPINWD